MHIVRFQGGFGNQLFQLAFYKQLIEKYGEDKVFADLSFYDDNKDHGGYKLGTFFRLNICRKMPRDIEIIEEDNINSAIIEGEKAYYYDGYWQDRAFFPKDMSYLDKVFNRDNLDEKNLGYLRHIENSHSISLHVRCGDFIDHYRHGNIANKTYYENAISYMVEKVETPEWFIFSDDTGWCRKNLAFPKGNVEYIEGNGCDVFKDMYLMSCCKDNIIANSSFSWWASELNRNQDKIVISPEYWHNDIEMMPDIGKAIKITNVPSFDRELPKPKFSILIPVYNSYPFIRRCLSSALNQTFQNIEIIAVNDGSDDSSQVILDNYTKIDKRLKIISKKKNESLLSARIAGMKVAKGDYILLLDSDDYLSLHTCEVLSKQIDETPADIIEFNFISEPLKKIGNSFYSDDHPLEKTLLEKEAVKRMTEGILLMDIGHTVWNKCYSGKLIKEFLVKADDFYCNMSEDRYFSIALFSFADSYLRIDDILYHYNNSNGMSNDGGYVIDNIDRITESISEKNKHLRAFLYSNYKEYLPLMEKGLKKEPMWIVSKCMSSDRSVYEKMKTLRIIDNSFCTDYSERYEAYHRKADDYYRSGRKRRLKILVSEIIDNLLKNKR